MASVQSASFLVSDEVLWEQTRQGNATALGELMTRYYRPLVHYGTKFTTDVALLEDGIQDLFTELWQRQLTLPEPASVKHYLFKAYRNQVFNAISRNPNRRHDALDDEPLSDDPTAEDILVRIESEQGATQQLNQALDTLSARQREAIYLRYYENLPYEQIATVMDINRQSVANLLQQGLQKLRAVWQFLWLFFWLTS